MLKVISEPNSISLTTYGQPQAKLTEVQPCSFVSFDL